VKFARIVFLLAGLYGLLSLTPLYFLSDYIGRQEPPAITHPQFYYGFVGVGLAFQFVFLVIASDPARFRPLIIVSVLEKLSYMIACALLYFRDRIPGSDAATALPDTILCALFLVAWFKLRTGDKPGLSWPPVNVRIP
jgi:hypothetical protein